MLMPKRTKYRRPHRVSYEGRTKGAWITSRQIEAARIAINRYMNRGGKVWIRIFPHLAKTKKPLEVRMGSGKGSPEEWVAVVKTGRVLFEVAGLDEATLREALRLASHKLPIKCKIIGNGELENTARIRQVRKTIARIKTVIRERELNQ